MSEYTLVMGHCGGERGAQPDPRKGICGSLDAHRNGDCFRGIAIRVEPAEGLEKSPAQDERPFDEELHAPSCWQ